MAESDIRVRLSLTGTQDFSKNLRVVSKSMKAFGASLRNTGDAAVRFGANIGKIGAAVATGIGAAATRFGAFEKDFTAVVTLLDDSSFANLPLEEGINGLRDGVIALRSESGESFASLNAGLFNLISAGVPAAEALDALRTSTQLALAGVTDTAVAVDGITTALGAFGPAAGDAEDIAEKFFAAQKAGKTTIEELSRSVGLVAATAKAAGVNFDELLGSVSSATVAGIRTNAAFTGLKAAIANIQKPTAEAEKEAARLGITFDATALRSKGLIGLFEEVTSSAKFNADSFIKLFGSVEALNFAQAALAGEGLQRTKEVLSSVTDETGRAVTFQNALIESQKTLSFQFSRFLGVLDSLAVGIGQRVAPALGSLLGFLSGLLERFRPAILAFFDFVGEKFSQFADFLIENRQQIGDAIGAFVADLIEAGSKIAEVFTNVFNIVAPIFADLFTAFDELTEKFFGIGGAAAVVVLAFFQLTGGFRLALALANLFLTTIGLVASLILRGLVPAVLAILNPMKLFGFAMVAIRVAVLLFSKALLAVPLLGLIAGLFFLIDATIGWDKALQLVGNAIQTVIKWGLALLAGMTDTVLKIIEFFALLTAKIIGFFSPALGEEMTKNILAAFSNLRVKVLGIFKSMITGIKNFFAGLIPFFNKTTEKVGDAIDKTKELTGELKKVNEEANKAAQISSTRTLSSRELQALKLTGFTGFASGGEVSGPGTSTSDSILARLSDGEFVMKARAVRDLGVDFLSRLNRGQMPRFADGGLVEALSSANSSRGGLSPIAAGLSGGSVAKVQRPLNLILPSGQVIKMNTDETTAKQLERDLRRSALSKPAELPAWY